MQKIKPFYQTAFVVFIVFLSSLILSSSAVANSFKEAVEAAPELKLERDTLTLSKKTLQEGYENPMSRTVRVDNTTYHIGDHDLSSFLYYDYCNNNSDYYNNFNFWPADKETLTGYRVSVNNGERINGKQYYFFWKIDTNDPEKLIIFSLIVDVQVAPANAAVSQNVSAVAAAAAEPAEKDGMVYCGCLGR